MPASRGIDGSPPAPHTTVLLSGGVDSCTVLALRCRDGNDAVSALHVDYGQAAARAERHAAIALANHYKVPLRVVGVSGSTFDAGEIPGRNLALISLALLTNTHRSATIAIGIHEGTPYADCSPEFLGRVHQVFDLMVGGVVTISAPLVNVGKGDVFRMASELRVPIQTAYSCESGNVPCQQCASCLDRRAYGRT